MSSTTIDPPQAVSNSAQPSKSTRSAGVPKSKGRKSVHIVLQGKGGVGKTYIASLVAQYLREHDRAPICFDTDPVNNSLAAITALGAEPVMLLEDEAINVVAVDAMIERIVKEDTDVVVDNGAASFVPLSNYLLSDNVAEVIETAGKQMVMHVCLVGGGMAVETASGLEAVVTQFPPTVRIVVWVNEYFGPVVINGTRFEDTNFYAQSKDRLAGVIHLRQQNPKTTGINLSAMLDRKQTFVEVLADPAFHIMPKQRLTQYRRSIWDQLEPVI
jgi:hypothetical protein